MRCLIVDDNRGFLEVARVLLEGEGVQVVGVARTVAHGITRVRDLKPDVILIDVDLGHDSGVELAKCLARELDGASGQVILMSAYGEDEITDLIDDGVAIGFLPKYALSMRAIEDVLTRRRPDDD
jgi:two-component system, NarL family, nitrate/nitrite response regulator NarL